MASFNKVILLGNLTREPQLSYLPSQTAVVDFGMAMNRTFKGQDGSQRDETCFVDCRMFGKRAEVISKYFHKGDPIFVEGRLKFDSWQSQDGSKRSKLRVSVENFEFVGGGGNQRQNKNNSQANGYQNSPEEPFNGHNDSNSNSGMNDDDIPF